MPSMHSAAAAEAQADRWSCFERSLSILHLRAYLKRLPDFDDVEAEGRALDYAQGYEKPPQGTVIPGSVACSGQSGHAYYPAGGGSGWRSL